MKKFLFCTSISIVSYIPLFGQNEILISEREGIDRIQEPVTFGIPFKKEIIFNIDNLNIVRNGEVQNAQFKIMSYWNDGSVKWVKTDFKADVLANDLSTEYELIDSQPYSIPTTSLTFIEDGNQIIVNTGQIQFRINKNSFSFFDWLDFDQNGNGVYEGNERIIRSGSLGAVVRNGNSVYSSSLNTPYEISVEESGPLKIVIKVSGFHSDGNSNYLKFETRIYAYSDQSIIKITHSYANDQTVASLNDPGDPGLGRNISNYQINLNTNFTGNKNIWVSGSNGSSHELSLDSNDQVDLIQRKNLSANHPFRYDVLLNGNNAGFGTRSEGCLIIDDGDVAVGLGISNFWEKYPKGISLNNDATISLHAVTDQSELLYAGMGNRDEYVIWFMNSSDAVNNQSGLKALTRSALHPICSTERYTWSDAFYQLSDCYSSAGPNLMDYINTTSSNHLFNREDLGLYSNLCFGDVPRGYWEFDENNPMTSIWGNNYYDCSLTSARLLVLTEEADYLDILLPMTRHWMDTDTWNTSEGDWLNGYCPAYSLNHRSNPNFNHHYGEGVWYYYYLTGDERAKEIGLRAARSIDQEQFWANENVLLRGASLRGAASLEAYKATGNATFLQRSRQQIDAIMSTQNQYGMIGNYMDNGNDIQDGQTFMMGLFSDLLWKYLQEDFDPGLRDQLLLLADFVDEYARVPGGEEEYYNFWNSPELPGEPQPDLIGSQDDFVYWNGKGLIAGLYAYAYYFSNDIKYKTYAENLLNHMWGTGYLDAFGNDFWGKASSQAMKNVLHAASIICQDDFITPTSNIDLSEDSIRIFPNPTSSYFTITGSLSDYNIEILNVNGVVIRNIGSVQNLTEVDIDGLGSGIYFLKAMNLNNMSLQIEIIIKQ